MKLHQSLKRNIKTQVLTNPWDSVHTNPWDFAHTNPHNRKGLREHASLQQETLPGFRCPRCVPHPLQWLGQRQNYTILNVVETIFQVTLSQWKETWIASSLLLALFLANFLFVTTFLQIVAMVGLFPETNKKLQKYISR